MHKSGYILPNLDYTSYKLITQGLSLHFVHIPQKTALPSAVHNYAFAHIYF